jgi:hypothetical protein
MTADVAMCVVTKDERGFGEWKEHYEALGVGAFYVKDHNSTVPLVQADPSLALATNVDIEYFNAYSGTRWPQTAAYNECLRRYGKQHKAMAFFDVDEFLVLLNGETSLVQFLKEFESFGALVVNWEVHGSSGHVKRPEGKLMDNYPKCYPADHPNHRHVKVIVNPAHVRSTGWDPHTFIYRGNMTAVNENREPVVGPLTPSINKSRVKLIHYVIKSLDEFREKMQRGASHGAAKTMEFFEETDRDATQYCDPSIGFPAGERKT